MSFVLRAETTSRRNLRLIQREIVMANTKNIADRQERKTQKRAQRKALKGVFNDLAPSQLKKFRKAQLEGNTGIRSWLAEQDSE